MTQLPYRRGSLLCRAVPQADRPKQSVLGPWASRIFFASKWGNKHNPTEQKLFCRHMKVFHLFIQVFQECLLMGKLMTRDQSRSSRETELTGCVCVQTEVHSQELTLASAEGGKFQIGRASQQAGGPGQGWAWSSRRQAVCWHDPLLWGRSVVRFLSRPLTVWTGLPHIMEDHRLYSVY